MVKSIKDTGPSSVVSSILGGIGSVSSVSFLSAWPDGPGGLSSSGSSSSEVKVPSLPGGSSAGGVLSYGSFVLGRFRDGVLSIVRKYDDRTLFALYSLISVGLIVKLNRRR